LLIVFASLQPKNQFSHLKRRRLILAGGMSGGKYPAFVFIIVKPSFYIAFVI
jgi:hypothetical protein